MGSIQGYVRCTALLRGVLDQTNAAHVLHLLDMPEEVCLAQLKARNPAGDHPFAVTEAQFHHISRHFMPPRSEEEFEVQVHRADAAP